MAVTISARITSGVSTEATHGPSGATLVTTAPADNGGDGSCFSPTDLVATAMATCILTILQLTARKHDLDLSAATASIEKHMSADRPRRIVRLPLTIEVPVAVPPELRARLEAAAGHCPVHATLAAEVDAPIHFRWAGEDA